MGASRGSFDGVGAWLWSGNGEKSVIQIETYLHIYSIITNMHVHVSET